MVAIQTMPLLVCVFHVNVPQCHRHDCVAERDVLYVFAEDIESCKFELAVCVRGRKVFGDRSAVEVVDVGRDDVDVFGLEDNLYLLNQTAGNRN